MAALRGKALIAYLLVCVVWGSTYLVIRIGVAELPPFLFAGLRFLAAGALLLGGALLFGDRLPREARVWRDNAIVGICLFAGGKLFRPQLLDQTGDAGRARGRFRVGTHRQGGRRQQAGQDGQCPVHCRATS